jgi:hypothetical protein
MMSLSLDSTGLFDKNPRAGLLVWLHPELSREIIKITGIIRDYFTELHSFAILSTAWTT